MATATYGFSVPKRFFIASLFVGLVVLISGCSNDAFTNDSSNNNNPPDNQTGTGNTGGNTQLKPPPTGGPAASTIVVSYPKTNAVENLGAGFYRRLASVIVTDQDGNAVADGTPVSLNIIDTVIAEGLIDPGNNDSIAGQIITSGTVFQGDGLTSTTFNTAYVNRNYSFRNIQAGDRVFLINSAAQDKDRVVNQTPIVSNELMVSNAFNRAYPAAPYDGGDRTTATIPPYDAPRTTGFVVGASLLGAEISGDDGSGNLTTGVGATVNGIAKFWITYPANSDTILSGCDSVVPIDTRVTPLGSAKVFLVATANAAVTTVDGRFCFSAITGGSLTATPTEMTSGGNVTLVARDGGDKVLLPYTAVTATVKDASGSNVIVEDPNNAANSGKTLTLVTGPGGAVIFNVVIATPPSGTNSATITFTLPEDLANPGESVSTTVTVSAG